MKVDARAYSWRTMNSNLRTDTLQQGMLKYNLLMKTKTFNKNKYDVKHMQPYWGGESPPWLESEENQGQSR